jgi:hypothetical protein
MEHGTSMGLHRQMRFPEISPQQHCPLDWHPLPWRWSPDIRGKKQQDPQRTDDPRIEIFLLSGSSKQREWNFQFLELFICNFSRVDNLRGVTPCNAAKGCPLATVSCLVTSFCSVLFCSVLAPCALAHGSAAAHSLNIV